MLGVCREGKALLEIGCDAVDWRRDMVLAQLLGVVGVPRWQVDVDYSDAEAVSERQLCSDNSQPRTQQRHAAGFGKTGYGTGGPGDQAAWKHRDHRPLYPCNCPEGVLFQSYMVDGAVKLVTACPDPANFGKWATAAPVVQVSPWTTDELEFAARNASGPL